MSHRLFGIALALSLFGHIVFFGLAQCLVSSPAAIEQPPIMSVELVSPPPQQEQATQRPEPTGEIKGRPVHKSSVSEQTVDLGSVDARRHPYFLKIKQLIESQWSYPNDALSQETEGTAVLRFSIALSGTLEGITLVESSGSNFLDDESLRVVGSTAFPPIPDDLKLRRLHIIARFTYRLTE
ncbi:MAG: energy transducer TonB [Deltaproteobacteria bacterium]|nr:energy transducer TonB [Deltaproteobacteria bacterium]